MKQKGLMFLSQLRSIKKKLLVRGFKRIFAGKSILELDQNSYMVLLTSI